MRRLLFAVLPLLVLLPALWAQEKQKPKETQADKKPPTVEEQYKELLGDLQKELNKEREAFQDAKTDEERKKFEANFKSKLKKYASIRTTQTARLSLCSTPSPVPVSPIRP